MTELTVPWCAVLQRRRYNALSQNIFVFCLYKLFISNCVHSKHTISPCKSVAKWSNIFGQTFEILLANNVWPFGYVAKHCLMSRTWSAMFLKNLNTFATCCKQKYLTSNVVWCGVMWPTDQPFCWASKFQMFDQQCLIVWLGPKKSPLFFQTRHALKHGDFKAAFLARWSLSNLSFVLLIFLLLAL